MFQTPFGTLLREAREQAGLTGVELAGLAGVSGRRISALENDRRFPSDDEVKFYLNALPFNTARVRYSLQRPQGDDRPLLANARQLLDLRPYFPIALEPAYKKFLSAYAAFPDIVPAITARLRDRPDFTQISSLTNRMRFDSGDEVLSVMNIFDVGAIPALHPPNTCSAPPALILDKQGKHQVGHRPHACMLFDGLVIFHQVTFATNPHQTVDLLVWDGSEWRVWEIDGAGHDPRFDQARAKALGIKVERYPTATVAAAAARGLPYFQNSAKQSMAS